MFSGRISLGMCARRYRSAAFIILPFSRLSLTVVINASFHYGIAATKKNTTNNRFHSVACAKIFRYSRLHSVHVACLANQKPLNDNIPSLKMNRINYEATEARSQSICTAIYSTYTNGRSLVAARSQFVDFVDDGGAWDGACIFAATRLPLCLLRLLIVVNFYRNNNNKIVSLVDSYGTAACVHLSQSMATRTNTRQTKRKRNVTSERYECAASVKPLPPPPSPRTNACRATKLFSLQFLSLLCARWRIFISFRLLVRHMRTGCPRSNMHRAIDWRPQSAFLYTIFMFEM